MKQNKFKIANELIHESILPNGMRLLIWQNNRLHSTQASLVVRYGSAYYRYKKNNKIVESKTGIAHFLEHVMFNMKDKVNASDEFIKLGTYDNAYTDSYVTDYYIEYEDNQYDNLKLLLDMVLNFYLTDELVKKEKGIIIEEKRISLDNPYNNLYFESMNNVFYNHNLKKTTLGDMNDIETIELKDLKEVYNEYYNPKNMTLIITGNCNADSVLTDVLKITQKYKYRKFDSKRIYYPDEPDSIVNNESIIYGNLLVPKIKMVYKMPISNFSESNKIKLKNIINIIIKSNFDVTSKFNAMLYENNFVSSFNTSVNVYDKHLLIEFAFESNDYQKVITKINNKMKKLTVSENDFKSKTHSFIANYITIFENNEDVTDLLVGYIEEYNKILYNAIDLISSIKYSDIKKTIDKISNNNYAVTILTTKK